MAKDKEDNYYIVEFTGIFDFMQEGGEEKCDDNGKTLFFETLDEAKKACKDCYSEIISTETNKVVRR